jgi:hypothetical protein
VLRRVNPFFSTELFNNKCPFSSEKKKKNRKNRKIEERGKTTKEGSA